MKKLFNGLTNLCLPMPVPPVSVGYIDTIGKNVTGIITANIFVLQFHIYCTGTCNKLPALTGCCLAVQIMRYQYTNLIPVA